MSASPDISAVKTYLLNLQDRICQGLEQADGSARFREDTWTRAAGGGGRTRLIENGAVFEKAGVAFSHVFGDQLPPSATAHRPEIAGKPWQALGVSLVIHPRNPYVPTSHANVRFFCAGDPSQQTTPAPAPASDPRHSSLDIRHSGSAAASAADAPVWWFGGGFDLTPYYGFAEDAVHWHRTAHDAVAPFGDDLYPRFKQWCDDYFYLKHRAEPRGVGGLFFDDFNTLGFDQSFALQRAVGDAFLPAYLPIVERRKSLPHGDRERDWQLYRRGRYVEFNLVWDRGTLFGLQSGGRTESILMSLPPLVTWKYDHHPEPDTPEDNLLTQFLQPTDWLNFSTTNRHE